MHHNDLKPAYIAIRRLRGDADSQNNVPVMRKDSQPFLLSKKYYSGNVNTLKR